MIDMIKKYLFLPVGLVIGSIVNQVIDAIFRFNQKIEIIPTFTTLYA
jgi:hypothetical protein